MICDKKELDRILQEHVKWLAGSGGQRANLEKTNLMEADLWRADLREANFTKANLQRANLRSADLQGANFQEATLMEADFWQANLWGAKLKRANLRGADFQDANLRGADLRGADLRNANFYGADLKGANLREADLQQANLWEANLQQADFQGADCRGVVMDARYKYCTTNLYMLLDQPGKIRAYKLIKKNGEGPYNGGIKYEIGKSYSVAEWCDDEYEKCGAGINLADLPWCLREWKPGYRILVAEFTAADVVAIPVGSDGKFRVRRCRIVGEKSLKELGLEETEQRGHVGKED